MNRFKEISPNEVEMLIIGDIGYDWWYSGTENSAASFLRDFMYCESKYDNITIKINSLGGSVSEGLPIVTTIRNSKKNVKTVNIGVAMSMAAIILMAGKEVVVANESITMIHSPLTYSYGNAKQFREQADVLDVFNDSLATSTALKTKKDKAEILSSLFNCEDHYFSAQEMIDNGYADSLTNQAVEIPEELGEIDINDIAARMPEIINTYRSKYNKEPNIYSKIKNKLSPKKDLINNKIKIEMDLKVLAKSLGLAEDASENDINAHLATLKIKAEAFDKVEEVKKERKEAEKKPEKTAEDQEKKPSANMEMSEEIISKIASAVAKQLQEKSAKESVKVAGVVDAPPAKDEEDSTIEDIFEASRKRIANIKKEGK